MNAPNSLSQDQKAAERKAYEPSMEEILASIRRIIADDQAVAPPAAAPRETAEPPAAVEAPVPSGIAEASWDVPVEALRVETAPAPVARVELAAPDVSHAKATPAAPPEPAPLMPRDELKPHVEAPKTFERAPVGPESLLRPPIGRDAWKGPERRRAVSIAPGPVSKDPLVSPSTDAAVAAAFDTLVASRFLQSNELLSEAVRELMRPMLKAWLDDNLPILVERLVRAEIERVARGGR
jgi:cell pole-organizing protein PopZ